MITESRLTDHTLLSPDATTKQTEDSCAEAKKHGFCSVCTSPCQVETATYCLKGSDVKACIVIGFPSGAHVTGIRSVEAK